MAHSSLSRRSLEMFTCSSLGVIPNVYPGLRYEISVLIFERHFSQACSVNICIPDLLRLIQAINQHMITRALLEESHHGYENDVSKEQVKQGTKAVADDPAE